MPTFIKIVLGFVLAHVVHSIITADGSEDFERPKEDLKNLKCTCTED